LLREGDDAVVRVHDTGVGMRSELLSRVFDLFVQADESLDRAKGGIGVGLTLVRIIAELHGGSVAAHSDGLGYGSLFTVCLPLDVSVQNAGAAAPAADGQAARSNKVVIVEDIDDSRRMLALLLTLSGLEVIVAATGPEGLKTILEQRPA